MDDEELTPYQQRMIELEEEKVAQLRGIRKELRAGSRAKKLHYLLDELDVDRDDLEAVFNILRSRFGGDGDGIGSVTGSSDHDHRDDHGDHDHDREGDRSVEVSADGDPDEIRRAVADAIASATGKNVSVEIEEE